MLLLNLVIIDIILTWFVWSLVKLSQQSIEQIFSWMNLDKNKESALQWDFSKKIASHKWTLGNRKNTQQCARNLRTLEFTGSLCNSCNFVCYYISFVFGFEYLVPISMPLFIFGYCTVIQWTSILLDKKLICNCSYILFEQKKMKKKNM